MLNLDLIVATSIAVVLFIVFIVATLNEFNKMSRQEYGYEKEEKAETKTL